MAERDPAFLYYDADVALDVSLMNRLERGCYFDLIQQYRKFRGYTMEQLRKILGNDFELCWNALELILEYDTDTKLFHIAWLRNSVKKRSQHNNTQQERIQAYWDDVKAGRRDPPKRKPKTESQRKASGNTTDIPRKDSGNTTPIPYENENENENQDGIGGAGEKEGAEPADLGEPWRRPPRDGPPWPEQASGLPQAMVEIFVKTFPQYPRQDDKDLAACLQLAYQIADQNGWEWQSMLNGKMTAVLTKWTEIVVWIPTSDWFRTKSISFLNDKFQDLIQAKTNGTTQGTFTNRNALGRGATNGVDPTKIETEGIGKL